MRRILTISLALCLAAGPLAAQEQEPDLGTEAQREAGRQLYLDKCAQCHGEQGDGQGAAAPFLQPVPRDFTTGIFKFRTSRSGELPTDADLQRSIREGMPYTSMPPWPTLSNQQVMNLVYVIKTFNDDFAGPYGIPETVEIPDPPSMSEASIQRGREVYEANQCADCHGLQGRGDGTSAPTLTDQWDRFIRPADLTKRWTFRGGSTRQDIYRTFTTGLDGTPMPSYDMPVEDRWALVDYVYSLSRDEPNYATHVVAKALPEPLDLEQGPALFADAPTAYFPVVGQVVEPERAFHPGVNGLEVRAVYTADTIAFLLTWHTMTADQAGWNSPSLTVAAGDTTAPPSDAVAVQLPMGALEGAAKPYFLFGDERRPVQLWFVDLARDTAETFVGRGRDRFERIDRDLIHRANYDAGAWNVILTHPRAVEGGLAFEEGQFTPIAFSVWDGFSGERGNARGITTWYHVYLEPTETQSAVLPMALYGGLTLLVELAIVGLVRRRYRAEPVSG